MHKTSALLALASIALAWKTQFINCLKALEVNRENCESFIGSEAKDDEGSARALVDAAKESVDDFRTKSKAFAAMKQKL